MATTTVSDYWISSSAINISLNAMGNADYAQVSIATGASIVAYVKDIIDYDNSHKCRTWTLVGSPTAFGDTTAKYVYVAIPRTTALENQNAIVVFPSELIDIYGINESGAQIGSTDYYYIYLHGVISASEVDGVAQQREFTESIQTGKLMSDDALMNKTDAEWYSYSGVTGRVTFLKEIIMGAASKFINLTADAASIATATITNLVFGGKTLTGFASTSTDKDSDAKLMTPSGAKAFFLSKLDNDTAQGNYEFKGTIDVFGNFTAKADASISGNATIGGDTDIDGDTTMGGDLSVNGNTELQGTLKIKQDTTIKEGKIGTESFATGLLGNGWRIGNDGAAEMDSLSLRKFLEVPELRYNRVTVRTGVQWQTFGGGVIEEVTVDTDEDGEELPTGIIKLKLEDGEVGAVAVDDKCMGIFHNEIDKSANATEDNDERTDGNFGFKGFMTIYFLVTAICDKDGNAITDGSSNNQYFRYQLRAATDSTWGDAHHPQASMSFAGYANANDSSRQACIYSTITYLNMLTGMTGWTFSGDNIALIYGKLDGFTITTKKGNSITLSGYGIAFGNAYMWGNIQQFERSGYLVSQQAYYTSTNVAPSVVLKDASYKTHYTWTTTPASPTSTANYVYVYWHQTFDDSSTKDVGLALLSSYNKTPRTLYTRSLSRPTTPTEQNPSGWTAVPSGDFDLNVALTDPDAIANYGFSMNETDEGIVFKSLCKGKTIEGDYCCSWMSVVLRGKVGDKITIPYSISAEDSDCGYITDVLTKNGYAPDDYTSEDHFVELPGDYGSGTDVYTLKSETAVLYFGYVKDGSIDEGEDTFTVNFGRLYSITEILDANGEFSGWSGVVAIEGTNGSDGTNGEDAVTLTSDLSCITWPMDEDGNIASGTPKSTIKLSMNIGSNSVTSFTSITATTDSSTLISSITKTVGTGTIVVTPKLSTAVGTNQSNVLHITAVANGYTRTIAIPITIITAGASTTGEQGIQGCVIRLCGEFSPTTAYYNDSDRTTVRSGESVRYIDVVLYEVNGVVNYYQRNTDNQGDIGIEPTDTDYWKPADKFSFIATDLLMADSAWIKHLTGKSIYVTDDSDQTNIVAGIQSVTDSATPMIFAGTDKSDATTAAFRVYDSGKVHASNIEASGTIRSYVNYDDVWVSEASLKTDGVKSGLWLTSYVNDESVDWTSLLEISTTRNNSKIIATGYYNNETYGTYKEGQLYLDAYILQSRYSHKDDQLGVVSKGAVSVGQDGIFSTDVYPVDTLDGTDLRTAYKSATGSKSYVSIKGGEIECASVDAAGGHSIKLTASGFEHDTTCDTGNTGYIKIHNSSDDDYVYMKFVGGIFVGITSEEPGSTEILN